MYKRQVLFVAGGAATAIMVQCALDGAKSITVFNRSKEGLDHVAGIGQKMMDDGIKCKLEFHSLSDTDLMHDKIRECDILINGTCVGMAPAPVSYTHLDVYKRQLYTRFFTFCDVTSDHVCDITFSRWVSSKSHISTEYVACFK